MKKFRMIVTDGKIIVMGILASFKNNSLNAKKECNYKYCIGITIIQHRHWEEHHNDEQDNKERKKGGKETEKKQWLMIMSFETYSTFNIFRKDTNHVEKCVHELCNTIAYK